MNNIRINTIYWTFGGEGNNYGIGTPTIFVRFQGCDLRCYKRTKGTLCDTVNALTIGKGGKTMTVSEIVSRINTIQDTTGIDTVCFTGGDPMVQEEGLNKLVHELVKFNYNIYIETSGQHRFKREIFKEQAQNKINVVYDYKLPSSGYKSKLDRSYSYSKGLDTLKFVVDDINDLKETFDKIRIFRGYFNIFVGVYWDGCISVDELMGQLAIEKLLGDVKINFQVHKLNELYNKSKNRHIEGTDI